MTEAQCLGSGLSPKEEAKVSPDVVEVSREISTAAWNGDYDGATWRGAPNSMYTPANRPHDLAITKIVMHYTAGYSFPVSFGGGLTHYGTSRDGRVDQYLGEAYIGWHAANWYYNQHSIGIEQVGTGRPQDWTDALLNSSAKLVAHLCKKYGIAINRTNIVGHSEVPGATHTDVGSNFPWTRFMAMVNGYAGGSSPAPLRPTPAKPAPKPAGVVKWINAAFSVRDAESNIYAVAFAHGLQAVNAPAGITPRMTKAAKDAGASGIYTVLFGDDTVAKLKKEAPNVSIVSKGPVMSANGAKMHDEARWRLDYICKLGGYDSGAALKAFEDALGKARAG